jgi:hypothetical protein
MRRCPGEDSNATPTLEVGASTPNLGAQFAADTNSYTLSRQSENIAVVGVDEHAFFASVSAQTEVQTKAVGGRRIRLRHRATIRYCRPRLLSSRAGPLARRAWRGNQSARDCSP